MVHVMPQLSVYVSDDILSWIDKHREKIGYNVGRSQVIAEACDYFFRIRYGMSYSRKGK